MNGITCCLVLTAATMLMPAGAAAQGSVTIFGSGERRIRRRCAGCANHGDQRADGFRARRRVRCGRQLRHLVAARRHLHGESRADRVEDVRAGTDSGPGGREPPRQRPPGTGALAESVATVDFGLVKNVRLLRGHSVQFRTEFFNLFNRVNLGNPVNNVSAPNFGEIISAGSPRVIQLALRYSF